MKASDGRKLINGQDVVQKICDKLEVPIDNVHMVTIQARVSDAARILVEFEFIPEDGFFDDMFTAEDSSER
jgi:hypothetical protein